jgi:hypothetical protein
MAFVVVGHGPGAALLHRQAGLSDDRAPGFATFRRPRGRWHGRADRHKARPRRATCR